MVKHKIHSIPLALIVSNLHTVLTEDFRYAENSNTIFSSLNDSYKDLLSKAILEDPSLALHIDKYDKGIHKFEKTDGVFSIDLYGIKYN